MNQTTVSKVKFAVRVVVIHTVSYILCGLLFHQIFDYAAIFDAAVIKQFMRPVSDPLTMIGPWLQPIRGLLFAFGLWLLRPAWIGRKLGWLVIWSVIFVFGIINTPAAAPSSIEGLLYSRLPLWYHAMGYAEVGVQTLVFSILVYFMEKTNENGLSIWQRFPRIGAVVRAVVISCLAYIGYAAGSIALIFISGGTLEFKETAINTGGGDNVINIQQAAGDLTIQFMFVSVFALNAILIVLHETLLKKKNIVMPLLAVIVMAVNILGLVVYQLVFSELMPVLTLLFITLLPTIIITFCLTKNVFALEKKEQSAKE